MSESAHTRSKREAKIKEVYTEKIRGNGRRKLNDESLKKLAMRLAVAAASQQSSRSSTNSLTYIHVNAESERERESCSLTYSTKGLMIMILAGGSLASP